MRRRRKQSAGDANGVGRYASIGRTRERAQRSHADELLENSELVDIVRWHILRADGQRGGLWTQTAAVLSADALVIAGTAVLISASSDAKWWSLLTAVLPLIAAMTSVYEATNIVGGITNWHGTFGEKDSPTPFFYSLPETVKTLATYEKFRLAITERSIGAELDDATSELWRVSILHRRRLHQLRRSIRWLQVSLPLLFTSVAVIISSASLK